jgi:hypothetical protein
LYVGGKKKLQEQEGLYIYDGSDVHRGEDRQAGAPDQKGHGRRPAEQEGVRRHQEDGGHHQQHRVAAEEERGGDEGPGDPQRAGPSGEDAPARPKACQGVPREEEPPAGSPPRGARPVREAAPCETGDLGQCQRVEPGAQQPGSPPAGCRRRLSCSDSTGTVQFLLCLFLPTYINSLVVILYLLEYVALVSSKLTS